MSAPQASLFDAPATRGASRSTDPSTSRTAARSMEGAPLRDQQARVLSVVRPDATAWDVTCRLEAQGHRIQQNVASKRMGELVALGFLRQTGETRPGSSHRPLLVFTRTEAGRAVA